MIYPRKVFEHQNLFLLYAQPQKFHQASNHCVTAIIWMSLKCFRLKKFCQTSKKVKAKHLAFEQYETISAQERRGIFHHCEMETGDRVKNGKRQEKSSNCRKHICLLSQLAYSSVICLVKRIFQLRRQADTGPHVQGKSSVNISSLLKRSSQAHEIKALLSK